MRTGWGEQGGRPGGGAQAEPAGEQRTREGYATPAAPQVPDGPYLAELAHDPDPLGGRDDGGPLFPAGAVDPRLPAQQRVLGIVAGKGQTLAVDLATARQDLQLGAEVSFVGVRLRLDGSGLRAETDAGLELPSRAAFWFAWSQFRPRTKLWSGPRRLADTPALQHFGQCRGFRFPATR